MIFVLLAMACPIAPLPRECVAVIAETRSVAECRALYQEVKATLPPGMALGFPECRRKKEEKND